MCTLVNKDAVLADIDDQLNKMSIESNKAESRAMFAERLRLAFRVRVLMKMLEKEDPKLWKQATQTLRYCSQKHKAGKPGFQSLATCISKTLPVVVGEKRWQKSEQCCKMILQKSKEQTRKAKNGELRGLRRQGPPHQRKKELPSPGGKAHAPTRIIGAAYTSKLFEADHNLQAATKEVQATAPEHLQPINMPTREMPKVQHLMQNREQKPTEQGFVQSQEAPLRTIFPSIQLPSMPSVARQQTVQGIANASSISVRARAQQKQPIAQNPPVKVAVQQQHSQEIPRSMHTFHAPPIAQRQFSWPWAESKNNRAIFVQPTRMQSFGELAHDSARNEEGPKLPTQGLTSDRRK